VATITRYDQKFEAPTEQDPANLALILQRIAEQVEDPMIDLLDWPDFQTWSSGAGEVGTPALYLQNSNTQSGFPISVEKSVVWNQTLFNNTGIAHVAGDLVLPDQDQRYWWWMGVNLFIPAITNEARWTGRLYVQDRDPATGQVLTNVSRYNQYMRTESDQYMMWDGLYRSGGGRCKVTMAHGGAATTSILSSSAVWAVRICPDR
jgi:hypothetical protein